MDASFETYLHSTFGAFDIDDKKEKTIEDLEKDVRLLMNIINEVRIELAVIGKGAIQKTNAWMLTPDEFTVWKRCYLRRKELQKLERTLARDVRRTRQKISKKETQI